MLGVVSLKFTKCHRVRALSVFHLLNHSKLKFNTAFHKRKYLKRQLLPCLTGVEGCLTKDATLLTLTILIGFLDKWKLAYNRKVREKMKALYLQYKKKKKEYLRIIFFRFTFSTKLHKNITRVIVNLGIVEENFFLVLQQPEEPP